MDGFILIHRKLLEWEWYSSVNDTRLFIHCLLKANWKDGRFRGYEVPRGSFITSVSNLAEETGLTIQQVKTSIQHLKLTNEITIETNHQFSIITINKYNDYQLEQQTNQQTINKRLTNEQQTSNNNRININKEINNKETISKDIVKKVFSKPTLQEIKEYCNERKNNVDAERFYNFYESKNWMIGKNKMKDWKACVRTWEQRDKENLPDWFGKEIKKESINEERRKLAEQLTKGTWKP